MYIIVEITSVQVIPCFDNHLIGLSSTIRNTIFIDSHYYIHWGADDELLWAHPLYPDGSFQAEDSWRYLIIKSSECLMVVGRHWLGGTAMILHRPTWLTNNFNKKKSRRNPIQGPNQLILLLWQGRMNFSTNTILKMSLCQCSDTDTSDNVSGLC